MKKVNTKLRCIYIYRNTHVIEIGWVGWWGGGEQLYVKKRRVSVFSC